MFVPKARLTFHKDRALTEYGNILKRYKERFGLYAAWNHKKGTAPQQRYIPKGVEPGSLEHQRVLFFTTGVTLRSVSEQSFRVITEQYPEHKMLFGSEVCTLSVEDIQERFKTFGFGHQDHWARYWQLWGLELFGNHRGDPIRLVKHVGTIENLLRLKSRRRKEAVHLQEKTGGLFSGNEDDMFLTGYGPKLFSLLCLFYEELKLIKPVADALPVDVHLQRTALSLGVVTASESIVNSTDLAEFVRVNVTDLCAEEGWSCYELSHALWFLGSKGCTHCMSFPQIERVCPVAVSCKGSSPTKRYWRKGQWDLSLEPNPKGGFSKFPKTYSPDIHILPGFPDPASP